MDTTKPCKVVAFVVFLMASPLTAKASVVVSDEIDVGTITAIPGLQGITFASSMTVTVGDVTLEGNGYVLSYSSLNATNLSGDGSHLSGVALPSSTQTFSGANTFLSSFTVRSAGRAIVLSTDTRTTNLGISADGVITFSPSLHNSSSTIVPHYTTTSSTFGPCVAGSTLTITTTGAPVEISYVGNLTATVNGFTSTNPKMISFLQDGQFIGDMTGKAGIAFQADLDGGLVKGTESFSYLINSPPPSPGAHSYCLTVRNTDGIATVEVGDNAASTMRCESLFFIKEIK